MKYRWLPLLLVGAFVTPAQAEVQRLTTGHLPNAVRVTEKVISGAQPDGEPAFAELEELGVKTIISVDGARPDVAMARNHGMRYVHLPYGYDGIPAERVKELAKAIRDLPGPIYVHCHHGKHRGPAAAAAGCLAAGLIGRADAQSVLKLAGTSGDYRGLFRAVDSARPLTAAELDAISVDFPATAPVAPLAAAMVDIDHAYDQLQAVAKNSWRPPASQPDLEPAHEALLLKEQFNELVRGGDMRSRPEEFRALARRGEQTAAALETVLRDSAAKPADRATALEAVTANCKSCHQRFRDSATIRE